MSILEAVVMGAVQGLTEFIPISSSGHLVIVPELFGWDDPGLTFDVLLHVASLVALLVYFRADLIALARGLVAGDRGSRRLTVLLVVGTIPAGIAGLVWGDYFEDTFEDAPSAALQLLITAAILIAAEVYFSRRTRRAAREEVRFRGIDDLTVPDAGAVGIAQAIAIFPGISRSGSTIATGLFLGMEREAAARFAFLLAIPALAGAAVVEMPEIGSSPLGLGAGVAGFLASLVTSYLAVAALIRFLRTRTLYPFAAYCVVAGIGFWLLLR